jgi:SSS family solute:Na+ symporter
MSHHFTTLDTIVLAGYFAATLGIGLYFRRRSKSVEGFTVASRNLPGWLCGLSILGAYVSSISFLAFPGKAFAANWNPFVFSLSLPIATWIGVKWFMPFYRRSGHVSAYSHLEERFGSWARIYASSCFILTQIVRVGMITYLMALPLNVLLGWDLRWVIVFTTVLTTIFAFLGGIVAVIWADAFQTVVLVGGAIACAVLLVLGLPGGPGQLLEIASVKDKFSLGSFGLGWGEPTFWVVLIYGFATHLQNFGVDQSYIQRYHAASSDREASRSIWMGGLLYIPLSALFFFIGTALFAYYTAHPEALAPDYADPAKSDFVFPYFIVTALPSGVTGLLIAAIFAAAMGNVASSLTSSATILLDDCYRRFFNPNATERQAIKFLRITTVAGGLLSCAIALAMSTVVRNALDTSWTLAGICSGGMLGLFLLGLISRRIVNRGAALGVLAGVAVILWMTVSPHWSWWPEATRSPLHRFLTLVVGTITIVLVGAAVTIASSRRAYTPPGGS